MPSFHTALGSSRALSVRGSVGVVQVEGIFAVTSLLSCPDAIISTAFIPTGLFGTCKLSSVRTCQSSPPLTIRVNNARGLSECVCVCVSVTRQPGCSGPQALCPRHCRLHGAQLSRAYMGHLSIYPFIHGPFVQSFRALLMWLPGYE